MTWFVATIVLLLPGADESSAQDNDLRRTLREVYAHPDFGEQRVVLEWRPIFREGSPNAEDSGWETAFAEGLALWIAQLTAWLVGLLGLGLLLLLIAAMIRSRRVPAEIQKQKRPRPPESLFGLDLRPETLPLNPLITARHLWEQGQTRASLSVLYRSSLAWVVNHDVAIRTSSTEGECTAVVRSQLGDLVGEAFDNLTSAWLQTAYGHRPPTDSEFHALLVLWQPYLESRQ